MSATMKYGASPVSYVVTERPLGRATIELKAV